MSSYIMTTSKTIESVNHAFIEPTVRTPIDNILFCSGGGIEATFTLGAIKQLLDDNNKFLNMFNILAPSSRYYSLNCATVIITWSVPFQTDMKDTLCK